VTKVLAKRREVGIALAIVTLTIGVAQISTAPAAWAAAAAPQAQPAKPAEALYLQLSQVTLDPARVYRVREASLDRSAIHITLEDGTIAFTQDVMGRVTGAFFEGEGEVLLAPPNEVERKSMSLFTGMAILEEHFETAYFRFNDDVMTELRPGLRAPEDAKEFVSRWGDTARNLAQQDALRLLVSFSRLLPPANGNGGAAGMEAGPASASNDRMLHARVQGTQLGVFDIYFDSLAGESIQAGQARNAENGVTYYDVWTSFAPAAGAPLSGKTELAEQANRDNAHEDPIAIRHFAITCQVTPPKQIHAEARLQIEVRHDDARTLLFELSRFLQVESVEMDGHPVEFLHNPAIEGTQLARRGNDLVAVILPEPARTGQKHELRFVYGGEVLAEAGSGLLYVGFRSRVLRPGGLDAGGDRQAYANFEHRRSRGRSGRAGFAVGIRAAHPRGRLQPGQVQCGHGEGWPRDGGDVRDSGCRAQFSQRATASAPAEPAEYAASAKDASGYYSGEPVSGSQRVFRGRDSCPRHSVLRRSLWSLPLQPSCHHADAGSGQPGLAGTGVFVVLCVSRRRGA
jgi:hypothetical protein